MRISPRLTALLTGLLLSASAASQAQTTPGQATLEEKKVQIWCATVRYVYNDNGRSNLNNTLRCDGTLKAFEGSIRADSQRVYSLVYQPLEGKGVMYKGLGSDQSRLQRLAKEIINKLGGSPQRRKDPARMAQLNRLQAALTGYVEQGTPIPGDIGQVNADAAEATYDSTATEAPESLAPADAGEAETTTAVPAQTASADSPMTRLFGPIALILSLLSLVLWFLERRVLRNHIDELKNRASRHRNELDSMKHNGSRGQGPETVAAELTFSQRRQIEELVERLVQQRLAEQQPHGRAAAEANSAIPAKPAAPSIDVRKAAPAPPSAPAPRPAQAPVAPPVAQAPVQPVMEVPAPPAAIPAGPPSAAAVEEFDSLVPPVQLPQPAPPAPVPVAPAPVTPHQPEPMPLGKFYVKVPVNGGFSDYDLHTVAQHDSIYEITPDPQRPDVASFRINPDPQVHPYAIQSAQYSLREACRYQPPTGPAIRIITEEPGQLRKVGPAWQIEQKAAIRFE
ncbi:hypothetical protein [Hymenobacter jeollabukensis]|uniref:Uncharacterized protein n=1 Tax=Hymenobacter jeollabukensis TaxID=2025313 RepID=A0A5R8WUA5_9BACT|nr:hypothetical protein [Hymenobacter jeollabukensis]TLM95362.1 hypothetical protein FDY95_06120 [Hymenobacter jeollabukensis]